MDNNTDSFTHTEHSRKDIDDKRQREGEHNNGDEHLVEDEDISIDAEGNDRAPASIFSIPSTPVKRSKRNPSVKCPICHEIVVPGQYEQHYRMELTQLEACASYEIPRGKRGAAIAATKQFTKGKSRGSAADNEKRGVLRDIQKRRAARQNNKEGPFLSSTGHGRRFLDIDLGLTGALNDVLLLGQSEDAPATCFICSERLFGSLDDINNHIDSCLTNPQLPPHSSGRVNISSEAHTPISEEVSMRGSTVTMPNERTADSFEEYTWAGQTRIRATSLFEGGMGALGSGSQPIAASAQEDVDDDLNVEDDEEDEYGGAQFTERDVVMDSADPDAEELREIVLASSSTLTASTQRSSTSGITRHNRRSSEVDIIEENAYPDKIDDEVNEDEDIDLEAIDDENDEKGKEEFKINAMISNAFASGDTRLVIEALRSKIKHLESASKNVPSCLICLEPYTAPLTSIVCWHVHCEGCWMKTLGKFSGCTFQNDFHVELFKSIFSLSSLLTATKYASRLYVI
ncbi:hypothetical protein BX616_009939 [Lobosporangium transversale]|uniref:Uncharacterized protein n=1 Tax=Lobosporangium transversale TaxID=64571 RepID=A0A1Y2GND7_9FUNG|nr:hypothetical protein BCR41DRAFT_422466 [Lobosporangium transversale]KAF9913517.1 hypothetical protein BX616_009939 [Lobosporangium transversale]ORZ14970.1 hypothetical protein BCR41DRAFT_422466 [Lobosporangium transversale]|eukprot:XP_021881102.1 hypothetical protein BCR41DRAFT_422466 [Lobosporangium transversale]